MKLNEGLLERVEKNRIFVRYAELGVKEGLFSDMAGALGQMQKTLVRCAYPKLVGRRMINVRFTDKPKERFPLDRKAVGYEYAEGAATRLSGAKTQVVDVNVNLLAESSEEWTREFVEDATWNVMQNAVENVGRALSVEETKQVIALYESVEDGDLAGGEALDHGGEVMDWGAVNRLHHALRGENWRPNVLVLHTTNESQMLLDNRFLETVYYPSGGVDLELGLVRRALGMDVVSSSLVPKGTAYAINTHVASVMLIRRDVTVNEWSDFKADVFGVRATTRFGLGILRSNAIAKMVNIKTTM
jgi:hypothetical protein